MPTAPCPEGHLQAKKAATRCPQCGKEFGVMLWKYHCHLCGKVHCDDCTKTAIELPPVYESPVRVCDACAPEAKAIRHTATGGRTAAGGRVLGGSTLGTQQGNEEEEREKRVRLLQGRLAGKQRAGGSGQVRPGSASLGSALRDAKAATERPDQGTSAGGISTPPPSQGVGAAASAEPARPFAEGDGAAATNPVLAAALRRQQAKGSAGGGSAGGGGGATSSDPEKTELLTRIQAVLRRKGRDEPFGLRSMETTKLRIYLRHLETE